MKFLSPFEVFYLAARQGNLEVKAFIQENIERISLWLVSEDAKLVSKDRIEVAKRKLQKWKDLLKENY